MSGERAGAGEVYVCSFCGQEHETTEMKFAGATMKVLTCPNLPTGWMWVTSADGSEAGVIEVDPDA